MHIKVFINYQVVNNEFNINAVKVVKTTAGDHLYIRFILVLKPGSPMVLVRIYHLTPLKWVDESEHPIKPVSLSL